MFDNYISLIAAIKKAKKSPITLTIEEILKVNHFQVRFVASNNVHIDTIAERINDKLCTTEGMEPVIILRNYKGRDSMLDGNHRIKAAQKSCATEYPVIYVEEETHSKYSDLQLREYALILNKIDEAINGRQEFFAPLIFTIPLILLDGPLITNFSILL